MYTPDTVSCESQSTVYQSPHNYMRKYLILEYLYRENSDIPDTDINNNLYALYSENLMRSAYRS